MHSADEKINYGQRAPRLASIKSFRRPFRDLRTLYIVLIALGEGVAVLFAGILVDRLLAVTDVAQAGRHLAASITGSLVLLVLSASFGLYDMKGSNWQIRRAAPVIGAWSVTALLVLLIGSLWAGRWALSSGWFVGWYVAGVALLKAVRLLGGYGLRRRGGSLATTIAVIGRPTPSLLSVVSRLTDSGKCVVIGCFHDQPDLTAGYAGMPWLGGLDDVREEAGRLSLDAALLFVRTDTAPHWRDACERLRNVPLDVWLALDLGDIAVPADPKHYEFGYPVLRLWERPLRDWRGVAKRIEDLVIGSIALLVVLPIMGLIALAIRLSDDGPCLHRQLRYGYNNKPFTMLKFRTMRYTGADGSGAVPTTRNDRRVTQLGRFLRSTSLDELPQLLNVLRGEMSLVGPRAHPVEMRVGNAYYGEVVRSYAARHRMKPGITGLAQVSGNRGLVDTPEKAQCRLNYDLQYVESWTLALDLRILLRTVAGGFMDKNAY